MFPDKMLKQKDVEVTMTRCRETGQADILVDVATVRMKSRGGSVKYQKCLTFSQPTKSRWETLTDPNEPCKQRQLTLGKSWKTKGRLQWKTPIRRKVLNQNSTVCQPVGVGKQQCFQILSVG